MFRKLRVKVFLDVIAFFSFSEETEDFDDDLKDPDFQPNEEPTETERQEAVGKLNFYHIRIHKSQNTLIHHNV